MTGRGNRERVFTGHTGRLSTTLALGWLLILLGRESIPPMLTTISADLHLTPSMTGLAMSVLWAVYALAQYPGGRLSDNLTRKTVLVGGLGIAGAGFSMLALSRSYAPFLLGLAFVGIGAGTYFPSTRGLLSDLFEERRGVALGIQSSAGSIGSASAAGLAVFVIGALYWQFAFVPVLVGLVLVAAAIHWWVREPYVVERTGIQLRETIRRVSLAPQVRLVLVVFALFMVYWQGVIVFLPTFLEVEKGLSTTNAAFAFGGLYVIGIAVAPLAGTASDRFGRSWVAAGSVLLTGLGLLALLSGSSTVVIGIGLAVLGIGARSFPPVMGATLLDLFPSESVAGDYGALKTVYSGLGSLGPAYVGFIADRASYSLAYVGYLPLLAVTMALLVVMARSD